MIDPGPMAVVVLVLVFLAAWLLTAPSRRRYRAREAILDTFEALVGDDDQALGQVACDAWWVALRIHGEPIDTPRRALPPTRRARVLEEVEVVVAEAASMLEEGLLAPVPALFTTPGGKAQRFASPATLWHLGPRGRARLLARRAMRRHGRKAR